MFPEFNSTHYFIDLLALTLVLAPLMAVISSTIIRSALLSFAGLYLLFGIAPRLAIFYMMFWVIIFGLQHFLAFMEDKKGGSLAFWTCIIGTLAPMIIWKISYIDFTVSFNLWTHDLVESLSGTLGTIDLAKNIIIPIGLSFAIFRAVDLLIKTYLGKIPALPFHQVMLYGFFPPIQLVGPIMEYEEISKHQKLSAEDIYHGVMRIVFGLIKVVLIAGLLQKSASIFGSYEQASLVKIWGFLIIYTWFFYLNFSGYSDLAIGVSRLYGYKLKENFCFPYFRRNIAEFWNNWHMSLSRFAQRNAFVPLGGYRKQTQYLAIFGTILVIALWHNISWGMLVFACYHGAGLIVHRMLSDRVPQSSNDSWPINWAKIFGTYLYVTLSFPLLVLPLEEAGSFYLALAGL